MAGTYKVWCNDEQKFVSGFKVPPIGPVQTTMPFAIDVNSVFLVERLSEVNKLGCNKGNIVHVTSRFIRR
jgi:hypothetical protein